MLEIYALRCVSRSTEGGLWEEVPLGRNLTRYLYLVGEEKGTGTGKRMVLDGVQHIGRDSEGFGSSEWNVVVVRCGW